MSKEVDYLEVFFQTAIDKIKDNVYTMIYAKGDGYSGSANLAQSIGEKDSLMIKEYVDKWIIQIYMPNYYAYVDEGVRGWQNEKKNTGKFQFRKGHPIPLKAIRSFMMNRKIVFQGYKGAKKVHSKQTIQDKLNQLAYMIGRSIKKKGTEGRPFYSSVITDDFFKSLNTQFLDVYGDKVLEEVASLFGKL